MTAKIPRREFIRTTGTAALVLTASELLPTALQAQDAGGIGIALVLPRGLERGNPNLTPWTPAV